MGATPRYRGIRACIIGDFLQQDTSRRHRADEGACLAWWGHSGEDPSMCKPPVTIRGITLIELMIALAILAVTLSLAAPAFGSLMEKTHVRNARSELSVALGTARIAAVSRTAHVVVCPSRDQHACSDGIEWQAGWIVFVDENRDRERQTDETVLSVGQARPAGTAIISSVGRPRAAYRPDGSATGSNLTLTFCERDGRVEASTLVINNAGRVRSGSASPAQAAACADAAAG